MSDRYIYVCNDCASSANLEHMFLTVAWMTKSCEFCGKRKPCVQMDVVVRGRILKALHDKREQDNAETEEKNV